MPSSEFIEIDIADNDVAILDASCVLSSSHQAEEMAGKAGRVSQTQESQVASPARMGMCGNLDGFKGAAVIDTESTPIKSPPSIRKKAHKLDATPARPRAKKATSKGNARAPTAVILRGRKNVTSTSAEKCTDDDAKKAETDVMKAATMSPTKSTSTVAVATPVKEESDVNLKNRVSPYGKSNCGGKKKTKSNTTSHITSESTKPIKTLFSFFGPAKGVEANVANKSSDQKPMATSTMSLNNDTTVQIVKRVECEKTEVKMDLNHKSIFSDKAVRVAQIGVDVSKDKSSVTDAITSKSVKEVTAMDRVKKAPVKKKKCSNVQTNNDITKIDDMTLDSLKSAPTAKNSFFNTATSLLLNNISASTEDSILLSKLDGSPVEAVAFASRSSSASRSKKRRTYYGPIFSKCSGTIVVDACDPASTVESDIKLELRKASIEEVQEGKVEDFEKKKSEIIVAISVNKSNDDQSRASKSDNSLIEEASSNKDKPKSGDTNQTTCSQKQDALNTQEADDDATVDLEDIPLEMKAAIDSSSPDDDDHDNADDVPLEIEGMGCVLVVEDDMTHGSSDDMKCESANKMGMKDAAVENKEVVNPSNNQVQRKTKKRDSLQPSKSPEAKKTSQSIESTYMMTETPKMIAPLAATFKNHANLSAKSSEFVGNKKQVSSPKPSVLITKADEAKQEEGVSLITKHTKVGQDSESKTAARVDARIRSESGTKSSLLSNDVCCRLQQLMMLREKYVTRGIELAARHSSEDFEEERLSLEGVKLGRAEVGEDGDVPDELLKVLLTIIQGSSLPLSSLAKNAMEELAVFTKNPKLLTIEAVSSKIKLLAQRKQYLSGHPQLSLTKAKTKIDCFENEEECFMWRWELSSTDLLPPKEASKVKKARSLRRKLQSHHKSIVNLISSIDKAISWLENNPSATSKLFASTSALAKVSDMEEKVLKFEREEEKARLLLEAKKTAEEARQKQNNLMEEARLLEKKRKQEEKERKKLEAAKDREVAKRNRLEEKEREKTRKRKEMEEKDTKQKARMLSFFARPSQKKKRRVSDTTTNLTISSRDITSAFDSERFRTAIDSQDEHVSNPFDKLSRRSKLAMQSKTSKINVSVFVTVLSDNPFSPQPYDEERVITVPNKYKFLGFHEDIRPPYHGTWSKPVSSTVTGRTPFGKDTQYLDYDIDSEAEWEEDDDDQGEDCDDDAADEEEEVAQNDDEENDGWLAAEDDLGIEEDDEETKELRKKIHSEAKNTSLYSNRFQAAVISPYIGGAVHKVEDISSFVEGIDRDNALEKLSSHIGCILTPELSISLDAFPPPESTENEGPSQSENEMHKELLRVICQFIHNSNHNSREKLVTELRKAHPEVASSRAAAMRELDRIAEKKRLPNGGGVVWFVKPEFLKKADLKDKDLNPPPDNQSSTPLPPKIMPKAAPSQKAAVVSPKQPRSDSPGKKRKQFVSSASANLFKNFLSKRQKTK